MIQAYPYFYDAQARRYLMQVVRAFSGFQYQTGDRGADKPKELRLVPCTAAQRNDQVAAIQRNNSENTILSVPMITVAISAFEPDRERMQNMSHVDSVQVTERRKDKVTGEYTSERGNSVTVERVMPKPYLLTVQVDIWTSNMDQKFQLLEQIGCIIFPSFDIQNSDNPLDWSALTTVTFESQNFSSLSIPIGTTGEIDVATIVLKIPMWITPPAIIKRQTLIQQVITNVNQGIRDDDGNITQSTELMRVVTTPGDHCIKVERGSITLLGANAEVHDRNGNVYSWDDLLSTYGSKLYPSQTQLRLRSTLSDDSSHDVVGVLFPTSSPNVVAWQPDIDTLPANTIAGVTGVLDPQRSVPGEGQVPAAAEGQRYLLLDDLSGPSQTWGNISARAGAIIQYHNQAWDVDFSAVDHQSVEYVVNRNTGRQLVWKPEQQTWVMAIDGVYAAGYFRLGNI